MEVSLAELWLPILVSAVFVFVASSIIHMLLPIHRGDFKKLAGEANLLESMRNERLQPGSYMFPFPESMKEMASTEMIEKMNLGPVGYVTVIPDGPIAIGKSLTQWFLFSLLIGLVTAYVGTVAFDKGAESVAVLRLTATVAFLGYGMSNVTDSIWKGVSWTTTAKYIFDGLVYGLATGGAFVWLWPAAT